MCNSLFTFSGRMAGEEEELRYNCLPCNPFKKPASSFLCLKHEQVIPIMFCSNYKILNINVRSHASDKLSFPQIKQPHFVGDYSLSPDGHFENSGARIRFLPELPQNLSHFSVKASEDIQTDGDDEGTTQIYLDNMFYFLASSQERFQLQADIDIVCTRDVLQVLMCSPYDYKHNWTIVASKYRNTIYMCQVHNTESTGASSFDFEKLKTNLKSMSLKKLRQNCMVAMGNYNPNLLYFTLI